jgi:hypothetical protein
MAEAPHWPPTAGIPPHFSTEHKTSTSQNWIPSTSIQKFQVELPIADNWGVHPFFKTTPATEKLANKLKALANKKNSSLVVLTAPGEFEVEPTLGAVLKLRLTELAMSLGEVLLKPKGSTFHEVSILGGYPSVVPDARIGQLSFLLDKALEYESKFAPTSTHSPAMPNLAVGSSSKLPPAFTAPKIVNSVTKLQAELNPPNEEMKNVSAERRVSLSFS